MSAAYTVKQYNFDRVRNVKSSVVMQSFPSHKEMGVHSLYLCFSIVMFCMATVSKKSRRIKNWNDQTGF